MDNDEDKLFEALTISREISAPLSPLFQGYGPVPQWWNYYGQSWPVRNPGSHYDISYTNIDGKKHRLFGPAYISTKFKIEAWYKDGELHREGGPAYIHKNNMIWFYEGLVHRLDGPAVIEYGGPKQFWIHGVRYSAKEYKKEIARRKRKGLIK